MARLPWTKLTYAVGGFLCSGLVKVGLQVLFRKILEPRPYNASATAFRVVITGGSKGIGLALAQEFLRLKDRVIISSRSQQNVDSAVRSLRAEFPGENAQVWGCCGDVGDQASMDKVMSFAVEKLGGVDIVICNAGVSQGEADVPLFRLDESAIDSIVRTNVVGTMKTYSAAMRVFVAAKAAGDIFLMEGMGSDGRATPRSVLYGASKAALPQLKKSLVREAKKEGVRVHLLQPGMAWTDLMKAAVSGRASASTYRILNILCEKPSTIARYLVPRIRGVASAKKTGRELRYLTPLSVVWRFLTFFARKNRLIDEVSGELVES